MSAFVQIARQPIIDANNTVFAYELFQRDSEGEAVETHLSDRTLSTQVILGTYNVIGRRRVVGDAKAFFNIHPDFLMTDIIEALPADQCVFELTAHGAFKQNELARIRFLFEEGYRFALDNFAFTGTSLKDFDNVLPFITYLKVDVRTSDSEFVAANLSALKHRHILIAQRIETLEEFSAYKDMGFEYFQGYYIKHPMPVKHYKVMPKHFGVTRLYKMLKNVPFSEFAREFERHNEMCIQLFQYLISCEDRQYDASQSVRDLVMDVGMERIEKWILLIVYSKSAMNANDRKGKLSLFFERRIDLMNTIVSNIHSANPEHRRDELRLLAIFSALIDLYQVPFESLMKTFHVSKNLELWLFARKGRFSLIYKAVNLLEQNAPDIEKVDRILKSFKTDYHEVSEKMHHSV